MKILRNFLTYLWFNLYFMAKCWRLKMLKRFRFGGQDSVTNPNPNIIRLAKITNPNPNIRDSEEKIRIRIRIFVTTLVRAYVSASRRDNSTEPSITATTCCSLSPCSAPGDQQWPCCPSSTSCTSWSRWPAASPWRWSPAQLHLPPPLLQLVQLLEMVCR